MTRIATLDRKPLTAGYWFLVGIAWVLVALLMLVAFGLWAVVVYACGMSTVFEAGQGHIAIAVSASFATVMVGVLLPAVIFGWRPFDGYFAYRLERDLRRHGVSEAGIIQALRRRKEGC